MFILRCSIIAAIVLPCLFAFADQPAIINRSGHDNPEFDNAVYPKLPVGYLVPVQSSIPSNFYLLISELHPQGYGLIYSTEKKNSNLIIGEDTDTVQYKCETYIKMQERINKQFPVNKEIKDVPGGKIFYEIGEINRYILFAKDNNKCLHMEMMG